MRGRPVPYPEGGGGGLLAPVFSEASVFDRLRGTGGGDFPLGVVGSGLEGLAERRQTRGVNSKQGGKVIRDETYQP